jgi:hypothetical protein
LLLLLLCNLVPGRDYHLFNTKYRDNPYVEVVGFTHAQVGAVQQLCFKQSAHHPMVQTCSAGPAYCKSSMTPGAVAAVALAAIYF